ncbi:MAG: 2-succinyl-5-enolpyruvyl-6-hydroxy-3-cyclohexene-1-carboxylic-acid synthase [Cyanobium sp. CZS 48M]|nr:2-succinyl-5-enolpyruvyl-6-hydroxy-3-cyclohexene-1-carboxylic-acid synthase [Cyanobium sp. CZS48M]
MADPVSQELPPQHGDRAEANLRAAAQLLLELMALGVRRVVLCPGSRSGPLAAAAGLLLQRGLQLHTAIDERSAGFFALGLARGEGRPAVVITTSGTAVANLLPAVVEAGSGAIPLLLLSADRPLRLKNCGANQTVNQEEFLAPCCRWFAQADDRGLAEMEPAALRDLARQAHRRALAAPMGPVHLNLPFEEPLHAGAEALQRLAAELGTAAEASADLPAEAPAGAPAEATEALGLLGLDPDRPGLIVAGPWRGSPQHWPAFVEALGRWQRRSGWPLLADGLSGLRGQADLELVAGYDLILEDPDPALTPPQVLRLGPLPASRRLQRWLAQCGGRQVLISEGDPRPLDPLGTLTASCSVGLSAWCAALPAALWQGGDGTTAHQNDLARWRAAEDGTQHWLNAQLNQPAGRRPDEPSLARALSQLLPPDLAVMLASSSPVRDWESFADPSGPARPVYGFRGASGIDGTLSLAAGLAESLGGLVLLSGDLALLHDANGWLWHHRLRGRLTVVLIENGGGGIFEQLPIRAAAGLDFERLFAMAQPLDHTALAAAHGVPWRRVGALAELGEALAWALERPVALLEVRTDRQADARWRQRLRQDRPRQQLRMTPPQPPPR